MTKKNTSIKFIGLTLLFIMVSQFACSLFEDQIIYEDPEHVDFSAEETATPIAQAHLETEGASEPTAVVVPEFINHPQPELTVNVSVFEDTGCPLNEYGELICSEDSPLSDLGCDQIVAPSDFMGGLDPAYPIATCYFQSYLHNDDFELLMQVEDEGFVYSSGGLYQVNTRYVIYQDGEFELIKTIDELQSTFAPITSKTEALSYALASQQFSAYYDLEYDSNLRYLVNVVEDTHVEEIEDGYLVQLYFYRDYGCGPHTTSAVDVLITNQGEIGEVVFEGVYENPEEDDMCTD
jgi:hypothetical protein